MLHRISDGEGKVKFFLQGGQGYLVLRDQFIYVKNFCFRMPEFIRGSALFPNKFGLPEVHFCGLMNKSTAIFPVSPNVAHVRHPIPYDTINIPRGKL